MDLRFKVIVAINLDIDTYFEMEITELLGLRVLR